MTSKAAVWRPTAAGVFLAAAAIGTLVTGHLDVAVFAGIAAGWAFLYAVRTAQIRETEAEFAAFRRYVAAKDHPLPKVTENVRRSRQKPGGDQMPPEIADAP